MNLLWLATGRWESSTTMKMSIYGMNQLVAGYRAEIDQVGEAGWYALLQQFDDANIYQTWAYGAVRNGSENLSHLVLKKDGVVVALAQGRIVRVPVLGAGIAYVRWGPLWRRGDSESDPEIFGQAIRALRNEYVCRRKLLLRLYPALFEEENGCVLPILEQEGFIRKTEGRRSRTILMDLHPSLGEIKNQFRPHWQRELKVAEKRNLEVVQGDGDELFNQFILMYKEMVSRKKFREPNDIYEFQAMQKWLPETFKMKVMLCRSAEGDCAGAVASAIGGTALYLFGATSLVGMKSRGSYLLQWKLLEWLKERRVHCYDLNGIDPENNPGTFKFKSDCAGDKGKEVRFLGRFESCKSVVSLICVNLGEQLKSISRGAPRW